MNMRKAVHAVKYAAAFSLCLSLGACVRPADYHAAHEEPLPPVAVVVAGDAARLDHAPAVSSDASPRAQVLATTAPLPGQPGAAAHPNEEAQPAVQPVLLQPTPTVEQWDDETLGELLGAYLERQDLDADQRNLALLVLHLLQERNSCEVRLRAEQRHAKGLQQKLEALTTIETSINQREALEEPLAP